MRILPEFCSDLVSEQNFSPMRRISLYLNEADISGGLVVFWGAVQMGTSIGGCFFEKKRKVYASQVQLRALRKGPLTSKPARDASLNLDRNIQL
eukprot:1156735-Pelagomonas_calceolata.AAC.6